MTFEQAGGRPLATPGFLRWLEAQGIDVNDCASVAIEFDPATVRRADGVHMRVTTYRRNGDGDRYLDPATRHAATDERLVPVYCPPGVIP